VAVVRDDGRFLLMQRGAAEEHAAGSWTFPGGALDLATQQDALEGAARRELREETGLEVSRVEYVQSHYFIIDEHTPVLVVLFIARYEGGEPTISDPGEVAAFAWRSAADVIADPTAEPWIIEMMGRAEAKRVALAW
jgi:8-oxo-dGTP diphosphatase